MQFQTSSVIAIANTASENASRRVMGSRRTSAPAAWTDAVQPVGVLPGYAQSTSASHPPAELRFTKSVDAPRVPCPGFPVS